MTFDGVIRVTLKFYRIFREIQSTGRLINLYCRVLNHFGFYDLMILKINTFTTIEYYDY